MSRPLVIVFQELATPQVTPTIPDLNTVVVGPAYDLLDYPDDATAILLAAAYGQLDQPTTYAPPTSSEDAVTVLSGAYPAQTAGSVVDHASVKPMLKFPRVILGHTTANAALGPILSAASTTSASDQTLLMLNTAVLIDFVAAGIQPGDKVILTSSAGQTVSRTVGTVGEPNASGLVVSGNEKYLRLTQNLPASGAGADQWTYDNATEIRIERELAIQALVDTTGLVITFPEPGTDKLVIKGGVALSVTLTPRPTVAVPSPTSSVVTRVVSYAGVYLPYRALRQDLQVTNSYSQNSLVTVNGVPTVTGVGKIDARNPQAVGIWLALQNSGTAPIYGYGIPSDDSVGHASARAAMSSRKDLYAFVPLTMDINIHASYSTEFTAMADPNQALEDGVVQKFRVVLGAFPLPTAETLVQDSISGVAEQPTGVNTALKRTVSVAAASTGDLDIRDVLPGDTVTIGLTPASSTWQTRRGTHKVGHVNSSQDYPNSGDPAAFEIIPGTNRWNDALVAAAGDIELLIKGADGSEKVKILAAATITETTSVMVYTMKAPTVVGGPYTIEYAITGGLTNVRVTLAGFAILIEVNGTSHTSTMVKTAIDAHAQVSALLSVVISAGASYVIANAVAATNISPVAGTCTAQIAQNDDLFNRFVDASATFLTNGVKAGDVLEIPLDPNNYGPAAFEGRLLSYTIASVISENGVLIANGLDDTDSAAKELPHYFARDVSDRYIDNATPNAMNYRIRRAYTKDEMVLANITIAQSIRSKRCSLMWPDVCGVSDLRDGSLVRTTSSVRALAPSQPGYYLACVIGGAVAGLPAQHGLTNLGLAGISSLTHATDYFEDRQLTRMSDGGLFVITQPTPGALPSCIHQLTTDPTAVETGELSVVKNVDFVSKFFLDLLEPFLGVYNVTTETQNEIFRAVSDGAENLKGRNVARIGPPLIDGSVTDIRVSEFDATRIELFFRGNVPRPLNTIAFHLVL